MFFFPEYLQRPHLTQSPVPSPALFDPDIVSLFQESAEVRRICGRPHAAHAQNGLSNRVFRVSGERGSFFLRLPLPDSATRIDRVAEAANMKCAASLGLAPEPLYCAPERGILLTEELATVPVSRMTFAENLGRVVGQLHASRSGFLGEIEPTKLCASYLQDLASVPGVEDELNRLRQLLNTLAAKEDFLVARLVPSHGDLSEGNCLMTAEGLQLIDWEYSGMSEPAWDLAYAIIENGLTDEEEHRFLDAYAADGAGHLVLAPQRLDLMKSRCDLVSALWALDRHILDPDDTDYLAFAHARIDRAARRLRATP